MTECVNANARRYMAHMAMAMTGYVVVLFGSVTALRQFGVENEVLRGAVAMLPVLPALYGLHAFIVFFRSMDEYHRAVISEATLISAGAVGFISFACGFAQGAADLPTVELIWILPAIVGGQGIAACFIRRRYQ